MIADLEPIWDGQPSDQPVGWNKTFHKCVGSRLI